MNFPLKNWEEMNQQDQKHFREMSEEDLRDRWETDQGKEIKKKIIRINFSYGSSDEYRQFLGTVKTSWRKNAKPKIDLRGIDFSNFSNLQSNEIFGFDFSNCSLICSNFSNSRFESSQFTYSDILYSDFGSSILNNCDFSKTNLTLTDFTNSSLKYVNFKNSWLSNISLENAELGFVKFNDKTDFHNIDISKVEGSSNPLFTSFIRRKHFLKHFKSQNISNKIVFYIWLVISDCGQSFFRWGIVSCIICSLFGLLYSCFPELFTISNDRVPTKFTYYYYSIVTFTTLGFGDIVPNDIKSEIIITIEVILGYIMLGGLISIYATKFIPKE